MTVDFLRLLDSPITVCFASKCLSKAFSSHPCWDLGPPDKKSSPCTTTLIPRSLQQNEHGLPIRVPSKLWHAHPPNLVQLHEYRKVTPSVFRFLGIPIATFLMAVERISLLCSEHESMDG